jgi:micrococcal nuclease
VSWRAAGVWVFLFAALAFAGGCEKKGRRDSDSAPVPGATEVARVVRVIDGDTIRVRVGERTETIRYIGLDTPETVKPGAPVECFGKRASAFNRRLVADRRVRLRIGAEPRDRYGRTLAYVYLLGPGKRFVNATLVARGYGRVLTIPPNSAQAPAFRRLERRAKRRRLGLWRACVGSNGSY